MEHEIRIPFAELESFRALAGDGWNDRLCLFPDCRLPVVSKKYSLTRDAIAAAEVHVGSCC
jgi:hypothetical protein